MDSQLPSLHGFLMFLALFHRLQVSHDWMTNLSAQEGLLELLLFHRYEATKQCDAPEDWANAQVKINAVRRILMVFWWHVVSSCLHSMCSGCRRWKKKWPNTWPTCWTAVATIGKARLFKRNVPRTFQGCESFPSDFSVPGPRWFVRWSPRAALTNGQDLVLSHTLTDASKWIYSVSFSAPFLAAGGDDEKVRIYNSDQDSGASFRWWQVVFTYSAWRPFQRISKICYSRINDLFRYAFNGSDIFWVLLQQNIKQDLCKVGTFPENYMFSRKYILYTSSCLRCTCCLCSMSWSRCPRLEDVVPQFSWSCHSTFLILYLLPQSVHGLSLGERGTNFSISFPSLMKIVSQWPGEFSLGMSWPPSCRTLPPTGFAFPIKTIG